MGHVKSEIHPAVMRKAAICFLKPFFLFGARFALPASYLRTMSVHLNNLQLCLYVR